MSTNGKGELLFEGCSAFRHRHYKKGPPNSLGDWKVVPSNPRKNTLELDNQSYSTIVPSCCLPPKACYLLAPTFYYNFDYLLIQILS